MSVDPHGLLAHVEPDLAKVINAAADGTFIVVYGVRTVAEERKAVETGHSTTMHSRHLPDHRGLSAAVDLAAVDGQGHIDWAAGKETQVYGAIAAKVKHAATTLGIPIEWGGDWHSFKDWGHFELPWALYP